MAKKEKGKLLKEFQAFISKGNVLDMAVGVIIGGAFGKIVSSLVADILMPVIGIVMGKVNFNDLKWVLSLDEEGNIASSINYGTFIQYIIDFLIMALCVFIIVKLFTSIREKAESLKKKEEEEKPAEEPAPPEPTKEEVLLTEIRDLLKKG